jgi:hypothetical protein
MPRITSMARRATLADGIYDFLEIPLVLFAADGEFDDGDGRVLHLDCRGLQGKAMIPGLPAAPVSA